MKNKIKTKALEIIFTYIVPIVYIGFRYDIFEKASSPKVKLTGIGLLVVIVLFFKFFKAIVKAISTCENQKIRTTIKIVRNVGVALLLVVILELARTNIRDLQTLIILLAVSFSFGDYFNEEYFQIQLTTDKEKRQQEIIDAFKKSQN